MKAENIIPELHRHRENLMHACGYDVKKLMEHYRQRETGNETGEHRLVSFIETGGADTTGVLNDKNDQPAKQGK